MSISLKLSTINNYVLKIEKKFSAKALSYAFPFINIDGVMLYDLVSLKYSCEIY